MKNMLLRVAAVLAGLAVMAGLALAIGTSPASAATPGCVSYTEWKNVHKGMTRAQVYRATGSWGRQTSFMNWGDGTIDRYFQYRQCYRSGRIAPSWDTVELGFSNYTYNRNYDTIWHNPIVLTDKGVWVSPF
jgi:hypothetical protein